MQRKQFLKLLAAMPLTTMMKAQELDKVITTFDSTPTMPVLFLGHGSPMNAIEDNTFVQAFKKLGKELPKPKAILCISAHWETKGTYVTAMQNPKTIHDFYGFPKALNDVQYPAPGSPALAQETKNIVHMTDILLDHEWGLDHGAWSVIKHLYPLADIPVIQMSIDYTKPAAYHVALAKELASLRRKGVLIIGSGNMVHNLRMVAWDKLNESYAFDWALDASARMKESILKNDINTLINYDKQGTAFSLAIPSPEHFIPMLYALALREDSDSVTLFNDLPVAGSLTMTSFVMQ